MIPKCIHNMVRCDVFEIQIERALRCILALDGRRTSAITYAVLGICNYELHVWVTVYVIIQITTELRRSRIGCAARVRAIWDSCAGDDSDTFCVALRRAAEDLCLMMVTVRTRVCGFCSVRTFPQSQITHPTHRLANTKLTNKCKELPSPARSGQSPQNCSPTAHTARLQRVLHLIMTEGVMCFTCSVLA